MSDDYDMKGMDDNQKDRQPMIQQQSTSNDIANSDAQASESELTVEKKLVRQTPLRWLMLTFGCLFLMGSYFCYDNPAPLKSTLELPPFNFSES